MAIQGPRPTAVAWGDRVFASRKELEVWLEARGLSYRAWPHNHPVTGAIVADAQYAQRRKYESGCKPRIHAAQSHQPAVSATKGSYISWFGYTVAFAAPLLFSHSHTDTNCLGLRLRPTRTVHVLLSHARRIADAAGGVSGKGCCDLAFRQRF